MKTKTLITTITFIISLCFLVNISISQVDDIISDCPMDGAPSWVAPPYKPTATGNWFFNIIIVYVMFDNEPLLPTNSIWPSNTTTGPSYKGTMLAESKNDIPDWWNAYNPQTQSISSWFCEVSRGQMHVVGKEKFVKLDHSYTYYQQPGFGESAVNKEIYDKL